MASRKERSEQAKVLRGALLRRMLAALLCWTAAFAFLAFVFTNYISTDLGNFIADATSSWRYFNPNDFADVANEVDGVTDYSDYSIYVEDDAPMAASEAGDKSASKSASTSDEEKWGRIEDKEQKLKEKAASAFQEELDRASKLGVLDKMQIQTTLDGNYALRDLSLYYQLRALKLPVGIAVYMLGVIAIMVVTLNMSLSYFNSLSQALTSEELLGKEPIRLPKRLKISNQQLNALQRSIHDHEHAAVMAEQRKNELVAYIAHDIRTPLTSVIGYLTLLAESPDLPLEKRAQFAGIALEKAERLESLVEEFFEITRYNLDAIALERENVDVALFARQVADEFGIPAEKRGISIEVDAPEDATAFIDPSKMARAVGNVLKNAVAYADPNTVISFDTSVSEGEDGKIVMTITNSGREISEAHLSRIFERFYREESSRGQEANAGLGLAIAREVVEAHGGTIQAESENGRTTFTIVVPN